MKIDPEKYARSMEHFKRKNVAKLKTNALWTITGHFLCKFLIYLDCQ